MFIALLLVEALEEKHMDMPDMYFIILVVQDPHFFFFFCVKRGHMGLSGLS